jgi:hypothetical protein
MVQIAEVVKFYPFSHGLSHAHLPYEKIVSPNIDPIWIDLGKELNMTGHRCDNFVTDHSNLNHILFSGCSVTYGTGLLLDELWSYRVWKDLPNTSGYFNIAMEGNSIPNIVFEVLKYCHEYGNPKAIILNLPEPYRYMRSSGDDFVFDNIDNKDINAEIDKDKMKISIFQTYRILEIFCEMQGIRLFSFSWSVDTNKIMCDNVFDTFFEIDSKYITNCINQYLANNDRRYAIDARDPGKHFGIAYHEAFYKFVTNRLTLSQT